MFSKKFFFFFLPNVFKEFNFMVDALTSFGHYLSSHKYKFTHSLSYILLLILSLHLEKRKRFGKEDNYKNGFINSNGP